MRNCRRLLLRCGIATALVLAAAASASASALTVGTQRFDMEWSPLTLEMLGAVIRCPLTLSGSFHSATLAKSTGGLLGHVTAATTNTASCSGGRWTLLTATLPWHVTYQSFAGTLPNIARVSLNLVGFSARVEYLEASCLAISSTTRPLRLWVELDSEGRIRNVNSDPELKVPLTASGGICLFGEGVRFSGAGVMNDLSDADPIVVRLGTATAGRLAPSPERVVIEQSERSDRFTVRNTGGSTVTLTRVGLGGVDVERPEFEARSPECGSTIAVGMSCTYTITVNDRPLRSGTVTIYYRNGVGGETTVAIPVEIQGGDFLVDVTPSEVAVETQEQNDVFTARNTGDATVTITRVDVATADVESPDFTVTSPGCSRTLRVGETCNYVVAVNTRPDDDGRVTIYYEDGSGASRSTIAGVDIAS